MSVCSIRIMVEAVCFGTEEMRQMDENAGVDSMLVESCPSCPSIAICIDRPRARSEGIMLVDPRIKGFPMAYSFLPTVLSGRCLAIVKLLTGKNRLSPILETRIEGYGDPIRQLAIDHGGADLLSALRFQ